MDNQHAQDVRLTVPQFFLEDRAEDPDDDFRQGQLLEKDVEIAVGYEILLNQVPG